MSSNQNQGTDGITEQDIANYLANNPAFFERHAELLASVQLSHPHSARAVSLQERQAEMLREKIKGLELKLIEMIRNGQENVAIADRLHRWTRALMLTADAAKLPGVLLEELRHQFLIPLAGLRLWGAGPEFAEADSRRASAPMCAALPRAFRSPIAASTPASRRRAGWARALVRCRWP